jgi:DNA modification methylase
MNQPENLEFVRVENLIPYARNSRTHSDAQVAQIAASIKEFGFTNPVLIDQENGIIAGHGRVLAAQKLNLKDVPCLRLGYLTEIQKRAYVIADNKLALNAGWNDEMLALEFSELAEFEFDVELTGFTQEEIDALMPQQIEEGLTDEDAVPELPKEPVTKVGDVWILGNHRLMCGDSTSIDAVDKLMDGNKAHLLHTDPPYGVSYDGKGGSKDWEMIKNDAVVGDGLVDFLVAAFNCANANLEEKAAWYIWHGYKGTREFYEALHLAGKDPGAQIVWVKNGLGTMWSNYRPKHECAIYVSGEFYGGYDQSTVWNVSRERDYVHPTQKPLELVEKALQNSSKTGQLVLDLFGGSGSTLIACEKTNRKARLMELDPKYVDVIVKRWQDFTGKIATHAETGESFSDLANQKETQFHANT